MNTLVAIGLGILGTIVLIIISWVAIKNAPTECPICKNLISPGQTHCPYCGWESQIRNKD